MTRCQAVMKGAAGLLVLMLVVAAAAEEVERAPEQSSTVDDTQGADSPDTWVERVDLHRRQLGETVRDWAIGLDRFFVGDTFVQSENETELQLRLDQLFEKGGEHETKLRLKLSLDLPNTSRRVKVFFDTDPDEDRPLDERVLNARRTEQDDIGEAQAGLEFWNDELEKWRLRNRIGVRPDIPLNPFYRFAARRDIDMDGEWSARAQQEVWYYDDRGWGTETSISFFYSAQDDRLWEVRSVAEFEDRYDRFDFYQLLSLTRILSSRTAVRYSTGMLGSTQPTFQFNDFFLAAEWRRLIHDDWLYLTLAPELVFPREDAHRPNPALTVRLEVLFNE